MPLYFFDIKDGKRQRDHDGVEFATDDAALAHARRLASALARDLTWDPDSKTFVSVIHERGHEIARIPIRSARREPLMGEARRKEKPPASIYAKGHDLFSAV